MLVFPLCHNIILFFSLCPIGQHSNVRLVNVNNTGIGGQYQGRIEILHNGTWGTICDHDWEYEDAQVACRSLGFSETVRAVTNAYYGRGTGRVWLDHVECTGTETSLTSCRHNSLGSVDSDCQDHSNDAGVVCADGECDFVLSINIVMWSNVCNTQDTTPSHAFPLLTHHTPPTITTEGTVRLVGEDSNTAGHVEIFHSGQWGTVCGDNTWTFADAVVVCRQLGFPTALHFYT